MSVLELYGLVVGMILVSEEKLYSLHISLMNSFPPIYCKVNIHRSELALAVIYIATTKIGRVKEENVSLIN